MATIGGLTPANIGGVTASNAFSLEATFAENPLKAKSREEVKRTVEIPRATE